MPAELKLRFLYLNEFRQTKAYRKCTQSQATAPGRHPGTNERNPGRLDSFSALANMFAGRGPHASSTSRTIGCPTDAGALNAQNAKNAQRDRTRILSVLRLGFSALALLVSLSLSLADVPSARAAPARERIEALCPELDSRGYVYDNQASWAACGDGAFEESQDVTERLGAMLGAKYDDMMFDSRELVGQPCDGVVRVLNPRILKACQSLLDSRRVEAVLRARITCSSANEDDDDGEYGDYGDYGDYGQSGDDYFYLYQESGPLTIDGLWSMELDLSTGAFEMDAICLRQVPRCDD